MLRKCTQRLHDNRDLAKKTNEKSEATQVLRCGAEILSDKP
jgi:hypothetical protein